MPSPVGIYLQPYQQVYDACIPMCIKMFKFYTLVLHTDQLFSVHAEKLGDTDDTGYSLDACSNTPIFQEMSHLAE